jgi:hypothetical protein
MQSEQSRFARRWKAPDEGPTYVWAFGPAIRAAPVLSYVQDDE